MEAESGAANGSPSSFWRLRRRQAAMLTLTGVTFLAVTAVALAATGDLTQPAGTAGCISETRGGAVRRRPRARRRVSVAVSPDGKSVYVASRQRRRGAPQPQHDHRGDHPARRDAPAASARRGRGPAPTAMGSTAPYGVAVSPDGKSVYVASAGSDAVVAPQPQHDHRGDHPARRDRRLRQRDRGGAVRRRPWARRPVRGGGEPGREERLRRLRRQQRRGAPQPQHDHRGDHPARRDRRLHQRDGGGAVRRRPRARRPRRWR